MNTFTLVHILISLAASATGFVVLGGWLAARHLKGWTEIFLATTIATSATGFFFPFKGITPGIVVGILSLIVLAVAVYALFAQDVRGPWQTVYVVSGTTALYFNFFVLIAQLFQKEPALKALAPTQSEPPFAIAQLLVLGMFLVLGYLAVRNFQGLGVSSPDTV